MGGTTFPPCISPGVRASEGEHHPTSSLSLAGPQRPEIQPARTTVRPQNPEENPFCGLTAVEGPLNATQDRPETGPEQYLL